MIPWIGDKEHLDTEYEILEICSNKVNGMKVGWRLGKLRITYVVYLCAPCYVPVVEDPCSPKNVLYVFLSGKRVAASIGKYLFAVE